MTATNRPTRSPSCRAAGSCRQLAQTGGGSSREPSGMLCRPRRRQLAALRSQRDGPELERNHHQCRRHRRLRSCPSCGGDVVAQGVAEKRKMAEIKAQKQQLRGLVPRKEGERRVHHQSREPVRLWELRGRAARRGRGAPATMMLIAPEKVTAAAAGRACCSIFHYSCYGCVEKKLLGRLCSVLGVTTEEEREMNATRPSDRLCISQEVDT